MRTTHQEELEEAKIAVTLRFLEIFATYVIRLDCSRWLSVFRLHLKS